nr:hypothetical protein GCM10020092_041420 [Actinoplanes digitatis]
MIGAFFFDLKTVNGGAGRPAVEVAPTTRVAVLGAGMMGAGIAYACARVGLDVVLKDVTEEAAARGRAHAEKLVGRLPAEKAAAILARITATADVAALAGCDAVIEAVFEDPELKRKVFAEVEPVLAEGALLASNTSTLPITGLAAGVARPADFIGMHFFSPVDKMPLLEIVVGEQTGDAALARAFDLGRRLGKTPIVVNDGRGFFTSRVIGRFLDEAIGMLAEGIPAPSIEQAALQAGYPTGPLALADEVSLTLMRRIRRQFEAAQGADFAAMPSHGVVDLLDGLGRAGRAAQPGLLRLRERLARPALERPGTDGDRRGPRGAAGRPAGAAAVRRVAGRAALPRRGCPALGDRRRHRLAARHRLPGLDRRGAALRPAVPGRVGGFRGPRERAGQAVRRPLHPAGTASRVGVGDAARRAAVAAVVARCAPPGPGPPQPRPTGPGSPPPRPPGPASPPPRPPGRRRGPAGPVRSRAGRPRRRTERPAGVASPGRCRA